MASNNVSGTGSGRRRLAGPLHRLIAVALLVGVAAAAYFYWGRGGHDPTGGVESAGAQAAQGPMPVSAMTVEARTVPVSPHYLGRAAPSTLVEVRARVNGFLEERSFVEGGTVTAGQPLFRIDSRPFEAEVAVARARVETARARAAQARRQVERLTDAARQSAASPAELDELQTQARVAESDIRLEEARLVQAELNLGYTAITALTDGIIGRALKDVGSYVGPGADSLLAVVQQTDPIYVTFSISERELLRWRNLIDSGEVRIADSERLPVAIELADGSRHPYQGVIDFVGVEVDTSTGSAVARAVVPNPERTLRPGQFARVSVLGIERVNAVLVPQRAVLQSTAGSVVYVVGPDGTAQIRPVQLGEEFGQEWVVREGLVPGDVVVTDRLMQLRPGTPVQPQLSPAGGLAGSSSQQRATAAGPAGRQE